jgi:hypothetical protein
MIKTERYRTINASCSLVATGVACGPNFSFFRLAHYSLFSYTSFRFSISRLIRSTHHDGHQVFSVRLPYAIVGYIAGYFSCKLFTAHVNAISICRAGKNIPKMASLLLGIVQ